MSFADADGAGEEQPLPCRIDRIGFDELARGLQRAAEGVIGGFVNVILVEAAFVVALRDARGAKAILLPLHLLAVAGAGDPDAFGGDFFNQTRTAADRTDAHDSSKRSAFGCDAGRCGIWTVMWKRRCRLRLRRA